MSTKRALSLSSAAPGFAQIRDRGCRVRLLAVGLFGWDPLRGGGDLGVEMLGRAWLSLRACRRPTSIVGARRGHHAVRQTPRLVEHGSGRGPAALLGM